MRRKMRKMRMAGGRRGGLLGSRRHPLSSYMLLLFIYFFEVKQAERKKKKTKRKAEHLPAPGSANRSWQNILCFNFSHNDDERGAK